VSAGLESSLFIVVHVRCFWRLLMDVRIGAWRHGRRAGYYTPSSEASCYITELSVLHSTYTRMPLTNITTFNDHPFLVALQ
jgi:hypothetical protein